MGGQNEMEQEIEFQPLNGTLVPFNGTPSSRVVNVTKFTRTFYTPTSGIICACVIVLLLFSNCVLLGKVASGIQGTNSELQVQKQILQKLHLGNGTSFYCTPPSPSPPPPLPHSPPPPSPPPPLQENVEYRTVVWNTFGYEGDLRSFFQVMMREGLTNNTFASCSWSKYGKPDPHKAEVFIEGEWLTYNDNTDRISRGCVIDAWLNKAAETKWLATNLLATNLLDYAQNFDGRVRPYVTFTRTTYTV